MRWPLPRPAPAPALLSHPTPHAAPADTPVVCSETGASVAVKPGDYVLVDVDGASPGTLFTKPLRRVRLQDM